MLLESMLTKTNKHCNRSSKSLLGITINDWHGWRCSFRASEASRELSVQSEAFQALFQGIQRLSSAFGRLPLPQKSWDLVSLEHARDNEKHLTFLTCRLHSAMNNFENPYWHQQFTTNWLFEDYSYVLLLGPRKHANLGIEQMTVESLQKSSRRSRGRTWTLHVSWTAVATLEY